MSKYIKRSLGKYLKDLAARTPAPGGGSVSAFSAALASSLLVMACEFSLGKDKYKKHAHRIKHILKKAQHLQHRFSRLVDEDVKAYMARDLDRSIHVPAEVCFLSYDLLKMAVEVSEKGNRRLVSDAALAALLAEASFVSGYLYVKVNVASLKDKGSKYNSLISHLKPLKNKVRRMRKKVEVKIGYSSGR